MLEHGLCKRRSLDADLETSHSPCWEWNCESEHLYVNITYTFRVCKCSSFVKANLTRNRVRVLKGWELQWVANNHSLDHVSQHIKDAASLLCAVSLTKLTFKQTYLTVFPHKARAEEEPKLGEKRNGTIWTDFLVLHSLLPSTDTSNNTMGWRNWSLGYKDANDEARYVSNLYVLTFTWWTGNLTQYFNHIINNYYRPQSLCLFVTPPFLHK